MLTRRCFSELFALKSVEAHKDALHYPTLSVRWTFKEAHRHSAAYARGLLEMGLKPGDTVSTWITCTEPAESNIVNLACYKAGFKVLPLNGGEDIEKALTSSQAFIFSPWEKFGNDYRVDHVLGKVPELLKTPAGSLVSSKFLTKYFVQTGFRTIRGTYKLKTVPVYSGKEVNNPGFEILQLDQTVKNEQIQDFLKKFESLGKGNIVNSLSYKHPLAIASLIGTLSSGGKMISSVFRDPSEVANELSGNTLIISHDKLSLVKEPCSLDKLILAGLEKKDIEKAVKELEKKGVKAKSVHGFNSINLNSLD